MLLTCIVPVLLLAVACGGGSSAIVGTAPAGDGQSAPVALYGPEKQVGMKVVYDAESVRGTQRYAVEFLETGSGPYWKGVVMIDGSRAYIFEHFAENNYHKKTLISDTTVTYGSPGEQAPFSLEMMKLIKSQGMKSPYLGFYPSEFGVYWRVLKTPLGEFTCEERFYQAVFFDETVSGYVNITYDLHEDFGVVREVVKYGDGELTLLLRDFRTEPSSNIRIDQQQVYSVPQPQWRLFLSTEEGADGLDAEYRELLEVVMEQGDSRLTGGFPATLAHAWTLFQKLYFHPERMPEKPDGLNAASLIETLRERGDSFAFYATPTVFQRIEKTQLGQADLEVVWTLNKDKPVGNDNPLTIYRVEPFSKAWYDGLKEGDRVTMINSTPVGGMDYDTDILPQLVGNEGTEVTLTIERGGVTKSIQTKLESCFSRLLLGDTLHLIVRSFNRSTADHARDEVERQEKELGAEIKKVIADLRGNGGGVVTGGTDLADYLIPPGRGSGKILTMDDGFEISLGSYPSNLYSTESGTLVFLSDGNTASASEIVLAAVRHYNVGTIAGSTSFGKGIYQYSKRLIDGSGVWIPAGNTYAPDGSNYHLRGLAPDIHIDTTSSSAPDDDPVLSQVLSLTANAKALQRAKAKGKAGRTERRAESGGTDPYFRRFIRVKPPAPRKKE